MNIIQLIKKVGINDFKKIERLIIWYIFWLSYIFSSKEGLLKKQIPNSLTSKFSQIQCEKEFFMLWSAQVSRRATVGAIIACHCGFCGFVLLIHELAFWLQQGIFFKFNECVTSIRHFRGCITWLLVCIMKTLPGCWAWRFVCGQ